MIGTYKQQILQSCDPWFEDDEADKQNIQKLISNKITHFATIDIIKRNQNTPTILEKEQNKLLEDQTSTNFMESLRKYKLAASQQVYNRKSKINFICYNKNNVKNGCIYKSNKCYSNKSYFQNQTQSIIQIGQQVQQKTNLHLDFHPKLFQAHVFQTKYLSLESTEKNKSKERAQTSCNQRTSTYTPKRQGKTIEERRKLTHSSSQKNRQSYLQHFQKILKLKQNIRMRNQGHSLYLNQNSPVKFFCNSPSKISKTPTPNTSHSVSQQKQNQQNFEEKMNNIQIKVNSGGNDGSPKKMISFNRRRKPHSLAKQLIKTQEKKQIILLNQTNPLNS